MESSDENLSSTESTNEELPSQDAPCEEISQQMPLRGKSPSKAPSGLKSAILQPISTDHLLEAETDEPLFQPAKARRRWYLGYLHHWKEYRRNVRNHWESADCKAAFEELKDHELDEPRPAATIDGGNLTIGKDIISDQDSAVGDDDTVNEDNTGVNNIVGEDKTTSENGTGPAKLEDMFRREVVEVVESVYNEILTTWMMKQLNAHKQPERVILGEAMPDPKIGPRFQFRAKPVGRDLEPNARLIGHVEYLGGRPGALTWAVAEVGKNSWGSLRCVLGDIAWCMLVTSTNYGFVVSSDEVIFLRFDIDTCVEKVDINILKPDLSPLFEWVDVLEEPHLFYSDPIKFTDAFDWAEGNITVKMGLLHLIHEVVTKEWKMQENQGKCAGYFKMTQAREKWVLKPPRRW
ncbi:hypothetical protein G6011_02022 [Alternaria panax]|uniref:Uncharacterized protein n=1 Tax=Alternaria panax TaxID=48097 RepID=A0AAD4I983_9PLEO|nr:hypothetical protein G6011_02022 [Alternaria panax]